MSIATIGFLVIILLFVFFLLGLEIGFSMALAGFIGFAAIVNVEAAMNLVAKDIFSVLYSYGFTVIAMFVFMGQVGASGGVARSLYDSGVQVYRSYPRWTCSWHCGRWYRVQGDLWFFTGHSSDFCHHRGA